MTTDKCRICSEANAVLIDCILCFQDEGLLDSEKIAAFDFDGCLAKTSVKRIGANAWSLMYPSIPEKLQSLYNDGYKLNKRQTAVDSKIGRLEGFIKLVNVPIQVIYSHMLFSHIHQFLE
nr:polynucleotide 3'-phosphatase ZDP [Ipomoea batatas]